jgi:hypothetical protein
MKYKEVCQRFGMKEGYQYDLFISYVRQPPVLTWVNLHFKPTLEERIRCQFPLDPIIFVDDLSIPKGSKWSEKIIEALRTTRVIIPIWSADYFRSEWCVAEWITMEERQKQITQKEKKSVPVLFPIKFIDENYFPDLAKKTQMEDLSEYNYTTPEFKKSEKFMAFEKKVEDIAKNICRIILDVPPWDPHWHIYSPDSQKVKKIINQCQFKLNRPRI